MGIQERKNRQKQLLRQEILDAAREMFVRDGYEGVSMRKIAQKIEYSATTIYHYFEDKAELLTHIVHETFLKLNQEMEASVNLPRSNSLHCLYAGMQTYVEFALENPSHYYVTFMFMCPADSPEALKPAVHEAGMKAFDYLRQGVRRAMEDGYIAEADLEVMSQTAWAGIHGVASLFVSMDNHFPFVERRTLVDQTIRTLLLGLGAQAADLDEAVVARRSVSVG